MCSWSEFRLPAGVAPSRYNLTLDVQMEPPYAVAGTVAIEVDISEGVSTRCIVLHAAEMEVAEVRLGGPDGVPGALRCAARWASGDGRFVALSRRDGRGVCGNSRQREEDGIDCRHLRS